MTVDFREILISLAYIVASVLFILGIKRMGKTETATGGNLMSCIAMILAVVATFCKKTVAATWTTDWIMNGYLWCAIAIIAGGVIGIIWAKKVQMTGMPQLVALLNGFGGLASLLVAVAQGWNINHKLEVGDMVTNISVVLTVIIGAITFTGSVIAWAKLDGKISSKAVVFKGRFVISALLLIIAIAGSVLFAIDPEGLVGLIGLLAATVASLILGVTVVIPIGGGDMPVIISLLNALSGLAGAMAGFIISNTVLIVAGCLVGTSGIVLSLVMCKAMNRSIKNLLFSGFGASAAKAKGSGEHIEPKSISVDSAYMVLEAARSVVIIPGYGMAVAQAQHSVKELVNKLEANGAEVVFAIHPVAGRMPGHMNVLLAEADISYDQLKTMEEVNPLMPTFDVAMVIGANDVVNPAASSDQSSPIYGMPIINADQARNVFVLKRGAGRGFSGIENELFIRNNTSMIYGDAKATLTALAKEFNAD